MNDLVKEVAELQVKLEIASENQEKMTKIINQQSEQIELHRRALLTMNENIGRLAQLVMVLNHSVGGKEP